MTTPVDPAKVIRDVVGSPSQLVTGCHVGSAAGFPSRLRRAFAGDRTTAAYPSTTSTATWCTHEQAIDFSSRRRDPRLGDPARRAQVDDRLFRHGPAAHHRSPPLYEALDHGTVTSVFSGIGQAAAGMAMMPSLFALKVDAAHLLKERSWCTWGPTGSGCTPSPASFGRDPCRKGAADLRRDRRPAGHPVRPLRRGFRAAPRAGSWALSICALSWSGCILLVGIRASTLACAPVQLSAAGDIFVLIGIGGVAVIGAHPVWRVLVKGRVMSHQHESPMATEIEAVLFDFGGTLFEYGCLRPAMHDVLSRLFERVGLAPIGATVSAAAYVAALRKSFSRYVGKDFYLMGDLFRDAALDSVELLSAQEVISQTGQGSLESSQLWVA